VVSAVPDPAGSAASDTGRILNELAQDLLPIDEGLSWFAEHCEDTRRAVLRQLSTFILQAHPAPEDALASVAASGLRAKHTPAVLILKEPLNAQLSKISGLPANEQMKAFRLLVALLAIADGRRRCQQDCATDCSHWWHHLRG
jgi:hypothetical protein